VTRAFAILAAFVLGFVPGAGYAYLGEWRLAAANLLTINWFVFGIIFCLTPAHCAYLAATADG